MESQTPPGAVYAAGEEKAMNDLIKVLDKTTTKVVRKQLLIIQHDNLINADEKQRIIDDIREQIKTGVVIIPNGMRAITCDADEVLITTEATS